MKTRFDRKVKNGKVKINGKFYAPSDQWKKYDGCFENTVQTFIIYENNDRLICHYNTPADAEGYYNWYFWNKVDVSCGSKGEEDVTKAQHYEKN